MAFSSLLFKMQTQLLTAFILERTSIFLVHPILLLATKIQENPHYKSSIP